MIILLGAVAARHVVGVSDGIMKLRGRWLEYRVGDRMVPLMPTLHPAYLLRQPAHKKLAWRDLQAVRERNAALTRALPRRLMELGRGVTKLRAAFEGPKPFARRIAYLALPVCSPPAGAAGATCRTGCRSLPCTGSPPPRARLPRPRCSAPSDVALYRQIMAAERAGETARANTLLPKVSDTVAAPAMPRRSISSPPRPASFPPSPWWNGWRQYRDLAVADRIYRLAVAHSTKKVRRHHKTVIVAVVTNIPVPSGVGTRTGGYEDSELPEPVPSSDAARRQLMPAILAAIKAGQPDQAAGADADRLQASCPGADMAVLAHRVAASYRAEGRDAEAYQLATSVSDPDVPQLMWDAGFAAYRLGDWANAEAQLEKLAENGGGTEQPAGAGRLLGGARPYAVRRSVESRDPARTSPPRKSPASTA